MNSGILAMNYSTAALLVLGVLGWGLIIRCVVRYVRRTERGRGNLK